MSWAWFITLYTLGWLITSVLIMRLDQLDQVRKTKDANRAEPFWPMTGIMLVWPLAFPIIVTTLTSALWLTGLGKLIKAITRLLGPAATTIVTPPSIRKARR